MCASESFRRVSSDIGTPLFQGTWPFLKLVEVGLQIPSVPLFQGTLPTHLVFPITASLIFCFVSSVWVKSLLKPSQKYQFAEHPIVIRSSSVIGTTILRSLVSLSIPLLGYDIFNSTTPNTD